MSNLVRNESIKLFANWTNSISVAVISAGAVAPFVSEFIGLAASPAEYDLTTSFAIICICAGGVLHLVGQIIIGGLADD